MYSFLQENIETRKQNEKKWKKMMGRGKSKLEKRKRNWEANKKEK